MDKTEKETGLALVPAMTGIELYSNGSARSVLDKIKSEVRSTVIDATTDKGRKEIASLAHKVSKAKVAMDEMKNQRAEHCTGCAGQGVEIHTTDGCQKGSLYFRKGGDFTGTGEHFTQGWMMGFKEVVALQQGVYAMYESSKLSYSFNRAYAPHPPVRLYYHLSFQWHFSPLV